MHKWHRSEFPHTLVNSELNPIVVICFGLNVKACACNMICNGLKMNVHTYHVICCGMKMYSRMYRMICFGVQNVCSHALYDILWCEKWMFACTTWYALVCKMYVCMYYVVCLGIQNVCLYVLWNMIWCAKCMFVCSTKYDFVCKMYVCMCYEIWFGVLSWTCQHNCLCIVNTLELPKLSLKMSLSPHSSWLNSTKMLTLHLHLILCFVLIPPSVACFPLLPST